MAQDKYITMVFVRADQVEKLRGILESEKISYVIDAESPRAVLSHLHPEYVSHSAPIQNILDSAYLETIPSWRRRRLRELSPLGKGREKCHLEGN